jgi:hypothetical protein
MKQLFDKYVERERRAWLREQANNMLGRKPTESELDQMGRVPFDKCAESVWPLLERALNELQVLKGCTEAVINAYTDAIGKTKSGKDWQCIKDADKAIAEIKAEMEREG